MKDDYVMFGLEGIMSGFNIKITSDKLWMYFLF